MLWAVPRGKIPEQLSIPWLLNVCITRLKCRIEVCRLFDCLSLKCCATFCNFAAIFKVCVSAFLVFRLQHADVTTASHDLHGGAGLLDCQVRVSGKAGLPLAQDVARRGIQGGLHQSLCHSLLEVTSYNYLPNKARFRTIVKASLPQCPSFLWLLRSTFGFNAHVLNILVVMVSEDWQC